MSGEIKCPYPDYKGNQIFAGDKIVHTNGEVGIVVYEKNKIMACDQWLVNYGEAKHLSRLCLQVGDKGRGCKVSDEIPKMTDPLGKHWDQPDLSLIAVDKTHAVMEKGAFNELLEYSRSQPSGVYIGKMWKRKAKDGWTLCWYGPDDDPGFCSRNYREIIIC